MATQTEQMKDKLTKTENKVSAPVTLKGKKTDEIKKIFESYKGLISQAIPKSLTAERVINIAATTINRTPAIAECSTVSILGGVIQASILGFELIPSLGQAYLVPFDNSKTGVKDATFMLGYRGMMDLALRTGLVETIYAKEVCENDFFEYEEGLNRKLVHKPADSNRGKFIKAYAVVKYLKGGYNFIVLTKDKIEATRKRSKAGNSKYSPWANGNEDDYIEMALKTCVRKLFKYMPTSIEYKMAVVDESTLDVTKFMKDSSGTYDFDSLEETEATVLHEADEAELPESGIKAEVVQPTKTEEKPDKKEESKPKNSKEAEDKPLESDAQDAPAEIENTKATSDFEKDVKQVLLKNIQTEVRKSDKAKNEFAVVCQQEKASGLLDLGEKCSVERLTTIHQNLQMINSAE